MNIRPPPPVFRLSFTTDSLVPLISLRVRLPMAVPQFSWTFLIVRVMKFSSTRVTVTGVGTKPSTVLTTPFFTSTSGVESYFRVAPLRRPHWTPYRHPEVLDTVP